MPALAVPGGVVRPRDRSRVVAVLGLAWLVQRVTEATGRVAARALETGTLDHPAELLHRGERRVVAHGRSLSDRVRLHQDDPRMPPERGLDHRLLARTKLPAHVQDNRFERS